MTHLVPLARRTASPTTAPEPIQTTWTKGPAAGDAARVAPAALSLLDDRGRGEAAAVDLAHRRHRRSGDRVTAENADRVDRVGDDSDSDLTAADRVPQCLAVAGLDRDPEEAVVRERVAADLAAVRAEDVVDTDVRVGDVVVGDCAAGDAALDDDARRLELGDRVGPATRDPAQGA